MVEFIKHWVGNPPNTFSWGVYVGPNRAPLARGPENTARFGEWLRDRVEAGEIPKELMP